MSNQNLVRKINSRARMLEAKQRERDGEPFAWVFWLAMGALALYVIWWKL